MLYYLQILNYEIWIPFCILYSYAIINVYNIADSSNAKLQVPAFAFNSKSQVNGFRKIHQKAFRRMQITEYSFAEYISPTFNIFRCIVISWQVRNVRTEIYASLSHFYFRNYTIIGHVPNEHWISVHSKEHTKCRNLYYVGWLHNISSIKILRNIWMKQ